MARVTNSIKYAIYWLYTQNKSLENIAKELKIEIKQVQNVLSRGDLSQPLVKENKVKNATEKAGKNKSRGKDFMITTTSGKKNKTVAIMTKEASALGDEIRKKTDPYARFRKK
jgi:hypothetical protein